MWFLVVLGLAALAFLAVWFGFIPPPHAVTLIRVYNGAVVVKKGFVSQGARKDLTEIIRAADISKGYIAILPNHQVLFGRAVPDIVQQRLRNVLLNQYA